MTGELSRYEDRYEDRFDDLEQLPEGWDSYGSSPLQPGVRRRAFAVLEALSGEASIGLTSDGGAHLTWGDDEDVIIEIEPGGRVSAYIDGCDLDTPRPVQTRPQATGGR